TYNFATTTTSFGLSVFINSFSSSRFFAEACTSAIILSQSSSINSLRCASFFKSSCSGLAYPINIGAPPVHCFFYYSTFPKQFLFGKENGTLVFVAFFGNG